MYINPFTPTFGSIPMLMAGRDRLISAVLNGLRNGPGDPNRATIFTGARGSGKTVLLTKIANEAAVIGWIHTNGRACACAELAGKNDCYHRRFE
jgi:hypothetical protein